MFAKLLLPIIYRAGRLDTFQHKGVNYGLHLSKNTEDYYVTALSSSFFRAEENRKSIT